MKVSKNQALAVLLGLLVSLTFANAVMGAYNYYHLKNYVVKSDGGIRHATATNCGEIELLKGALRATIEEAQKFTRTSKIRSREEKRQSEQYYRDVLIKFQSRDCKPKPKEKKWSKNSSKSSSATPRQSRSGKHQSSTFSWPPASTPSSATPTRP